jgi:adenylosuccinate lyase
LWLQDFIMDFEDLTAIMESIPARGVKGTTGTQASFVELFKGDEAKIKQLDKRVCELLGFSRSIAVSGQTYTRKLDYKVKFFHFFRLW